MAQKVTGYIKLQIEAGKATPAPPVGPALGQKGVNIMAFTKEFNERIVRIGFIPVSSACKRIGRHPIGFRQLVLFFKSVMTVMHDIGSL